MKSQKGHTSRYSPKQSRINDPNRRTQRRRTAEYLLQHEGATPLELKIHCNVLHHPRRVIELCCDLGWPMETQWRRVQDAQGRPHRVGSYVLLKTGVDAMSKIHHARLAMRAAKRMSTSTRKRQTANTFFHHLKESI